MRALVVGVLLAGLLTGCGGNSKGDYCDAVKKHQTELSDIVSTGKSDALINALDIFHDLQDKAPGDITDEWQQLIGRIEALRDALDEAGVDPATYDRDKPPAGLTAVQLARIDAAAKELGSGTTLRALQDLGQEARDVCQTPLTL